MVTTSPARKRLLHRSRHVTTPTSVALEIGLHAHSAHTADDGR